MIFSLFSSSFLENPHMGSRRFALLLLSLLSSLFVLVQSQSGSTGDASVMQDLKNSLKSPSSLSWTDSNPCNWKHVGCSNDGRVVGIQIGHQNLQGSLPSSLVQLTALQRLEVMGNQLGGPLPSLSGLSSLGYLLLSNNNFTSIPSDFFLGMTSLVEIYLDYNPFAAWQIPDSLRNASNLQVFSVDSANITGKLPHFFGGDAFPELRNLHLAFNNLEGGLPASFSGSSIQSLWLNGQRSSSRLNGSIAVLQNMTQLAEVWLYGNSFSGPLPDFSELTFLQDCSVRDNAITGIVPASFVNLPLLKVVNLTNNHLQGPTPKFKSSVSVDMIPGSNSFCLPDLGAPCDPRVNTLLSIAESFGYPNAFGENWKGNDPCTWLGVSCFSGNITVVSFSKMGLTGTISPNFSSLTTLQKLILANNDLTGIIPNELTALPNLVQLDVSNNRLHGKIPPFKSIVIVKTGGNPDIGKDTVSPSPGTPGTPSADTPGSQNGGGGTSRSGGNNKSSTGVVVGSVIGGVSAAFIVGVGVFCLYRAKQKHSGRVQSPNAMVIHPRLSGSDCDAVIEAGSMVISIQVLKSVTNNFSEENILGRGGFGTVYKGELHDGTKIAVKRRESGVVSEKCLDEFKSEIAVLTKVRHRHLVAFLGYCLDGNEKLLVYEYMPQGTLSRHLFNWKEEALKPLEWSKRLTVALDVARGVEYLHGLAHQSFIHRDLKPSNILLGDDMRAKVADFGLVRLAPDGKASVVTSVIAGTFGYLAPEYAETGRVTTKIDVFSFGVTLMELITGRRAIDEIQESVHLATWFRRMHINKDTFRRAIDPTIDLDDETLASISTVAELAAHCCAREPSQRPDMGHAVNVLSSLAELWKPSNLDLEEIYGIDFDMACYMTEYNHRQKGKGAEEERRVRQMGGAQYSTTEKMKIGRGEKSTENPCKAHLSAAEALNHSSETRSNLGRWRCLELKGPDMSNLCPQISPCVLHMEGQDPPSDILNRSRTMETSGGSEYIRANKIFGGNRCSVDGGQPVEAIEETCKVTCKKSVGPSGRM